MSQSSDRQPGTADVPAADRGPDDGPDQGIDVSYARVAAEDADESVAHEGESVEAIESADGTGPADAAGGVESDNDTAPEQPTISTMMGTGPVGEGDAASI